MKPNFLFLVTVMVMNAVAFIHPAVISAQTPQAWSEGYCQIGGVATIQGLQCMMQNVFSVAITAIGLMAFVMLIFGSFSYLMSGGNSNGTQKARSIITFSVVGIVVALSAFIILNLVANFTGVQEITNFSIPESGDGTTLQGVPR
jgi:hypothetical protein